jgi:hypothetical protein
VVVEPSPVVDVEPCVVLVVAAGWVGMVGLPVVEVEEDPVPFEPLVVVVVEEVVDDVGLA